MKLAAEMHMNPKTKRHLLAAVVLYAVGFVLFADQALATRAVRVYELTVPQTDPAAAFTEAMRQVLVRATGRRDADSDPALASLLSQAKRYVQVVRPAASGGTQIVMDGEAIERAITAAGKTLWPRERPLTLIVLQGGPASAMGDAGRKTLEEVAKRRGLPISVVAVGALNLPTSGEITREVALPAAQRMGADAVLIGTGDRAALGGEWQWTLYGANSNENWSGSLEAGVHGATDAYARASDVLLALPETETVVEIGGVSSLKDYASVTNILGDLPGVRRVQLTEAAGANAVFRVLARGGADALLTGLGSHSRFERAEAVARGALAFRWRN